MGKSLKNKVSLPSEEFWDSIIHASSLVIDCDICGRTHYCINQSEGDYTLGEFEDLERKHKENPDKYIQHTEFTPWGTIDGKQVVYGCPCHETNETLARYERFVLNNRRIIASYLQKVAEKKLKFAQQDCQLASQIDTSVKNLD